MERADRGCQPEKLEARSKPGFAGQQHAVSIPSKLFRTLPGLHDPPTCFVLDPLAGSLAAAKLAERLGCGRLLHCLVPGGV